MGAREDVLFEVRCPGLKDKVLEAVQTMPDDIRAVWDKESHCYELSEDKIRYLGYSVKWYPMYGFVKLTDWLWELFEDEDEASGAYLLTGPDDDTPTENYIGAGWEIAYVFVNKGIALLEEE